MSFFRTKASIVGALLRMDWTLAQATLIFDEIGPGLVLMSPERSISKDSFERERMEQVEGIE